MSWIGRRALIAITAGNAALLLGTVLALVIPLPDLAVGGSAVIEYADGEPAYVFLAPGDKWRLPVSVEAVDPAFIRALVALEDKRFWRHAGVDPLAIVRAAASDVRARRRVSGGSTLTMQLARLLEPRPRTLASKLLDMLRAVQLDLRLSKREILTQYLERAPYGGNVEGVAAAAWSYFGHGPRHLTPLEIATLLAVPQGPRRLAPGPGNTPRLRARRDAILDKLIAAVAVAPADARSALADAAATAPPDRLRRMPRQAAHAAVMLHRRYPGAPRVRATLDAGIQALAERQVALRRGELRAKGIHAAAVVVVDHRSRDVVALVGNLEFGDAAHGGQIAMFGRPRSPGSTLKPLLYAIAIDRGLALPDYLVADVPAQYGSYRPHNFDGDWSGLVTLHDALSRSLNLPFVDLLDRLGVESFVGELARMGVGPARTAPGQYGLSMIVGGIELSPLELAGLYATLAEDGVYRPLRLVAAAPAAASVRDARSFGPGAAWLTRQALAQNDRPDFPRRRDIAGAPPAIHWKTGTSFGFRDAWAVGSGPAYTAVVWTGNVDNRPSADLVGSEAAGPLLFDVLDAVAGRAGESTDEVTGEVTTDLTEVEICAYSGHIAGDACPERTRVRAPVHAVPTAACPYHQAYDVDRATGRAVLPACRKPGRVYDRRSFVVLSSAITAWLTSHHRAVPELPVFDADCGADLASAPPVILTPGAGQVVTLLPGVPASRQRVPLSASTHAARLSWFIDGALIATAASSERVFWVPASGVHTLVVEDDAGRKARRVVTVDRPGIAGAR